MPDHRDLQKAAEHEAAHAVMRWVRGLPATQLWANEDGSGYCDGHPRRARHDDVPYVVLAGYVPETGYGLAVPDFATSKVADFDRAREILESAEWLVGYDAEAGNQRSVEAALKEHFLYACDQLSEHIELVDAIADRLFESRRLSARTVAALCREHGRRTTR
jgi:hypothetical protein